MEKSNFSDIDIEILSLMRSRENYRKRYHRNYEQEEMKDAGTYGACTSNARKDRVQ